MDCISDSDSVLLVLGGVGDKDPWERRSAVWCDVVVGASLGAIRSFGGGATAGEAAVGEVEQEAIILLYVHLKSVLFF